MKLGWLELRRRPGRFALVGSALVLLVLLMLFLGKLLDGLFLGSTGAIRVHEADRFVFSEDARQSLLRSDIHEPELDAIEALEGVSSARGMGVSLLGLATIDDDEILNGAIAGYESAGGGLPAPPATGEALADRRLAGLGVDLGDTLLVGPARISVVVSGWVEDSNYLLQNGVWVNGETWRNVQNANRPDAVVGPDEWQIAILRFEQGADAESVTVAVEDLTGGEVLSERDASFAIPGVPEQNSTLIAVIYVTAVVVALVIALFFALLTLERAPLYALLKATGASDRTLVAGLVLQSVTVAVGAYAIGGVLSFLLGLVTPAEVPIEYRPSRAIFVFVAVVIAALFGGLTSLRRVTRIDPASALGTGL